MFEAPNINYFLILAECLFFAGAIPKRRKAFLLVVGMQLILMLSLRNVTVGIDTETYTEMFYHTLYVAPPDYFEIGNKLVLWGITRITNNPVAMYAFYAVTSITLVLYFIYKRSKNIYFSVVIYTSFMFYYWAFNAMRQALAISICLVAIDFLIDNNDRKFLVCVVLAACFHSSAVIVLACILIKKLNFRINRNWIVWIAMLSIISAVFSQQLVLLMVRIVPQYASYLNSDFASMGNYLHPILYGAIFVFLCMIRVKTQSHADEFCLLMIGIGVVIYFMSIGIQIMNRLTYYFVIPILVVLPNEIGEIRNQKNRIIYKMCFYSFFTVYEVLLIFRKAQGIVPYSFFWQ